MHSGSQTTSTHHHSHNGHQRRSIKRSLSTSILPLPPPLETLLAAHKVKKAASVTGNDYHSPHTEPSTEEDEGAFSFDDDDEDHDEEEEEEEERFNTGDSGRYDLWSAATKKEGEEEQDERDEVESQASLRQGFVELAFATSTTSSTPYPSSASSSTHHWHQQQRHHHHHHQIEEEEDEQGRSERMPSSVPLPAAAARSAAFWGLHQSAALEGGANRKRSNGTGSSSQPRLDREEADLVVDEKEEENGVTIREVVGDGEEEGDEEDEEEHSYDGDEEEDEEDEGGEEGAREKRFEGCLPTILYTEPVPLPPRFAVTAMEVDIDHDVIRPSSFPSSAFMMKEQQKQASGSSYTRNATSAAAAGASCSSSYPLSIVAGSAAVGGGGGGGEGMMLLSPSSSSSYTSAPSACSSTIKAAAAGSASIPSSTSSGTATSSSSCPSFSAAGLASIPISDNTSFTFSSSSSSSAAAGAAQSASMFTFSSDISNSMATSSSSSLSSAAAAVEAAQAAEARASEVIAMIESDLKPEEMLAMEETVAAAVKREAAMACNNNNNNRNNNRGEGPASITLPSSHSSSIFGTTSTNRGLPPRPHPVSRSYSDTNTSHRYHYHRHRRRGPSAAAASSSIGEVEGRTAGQAGSSVTSTTMGGVVEEGGMPSFTSSSSSYQQQQQHLPSSSSSTYHHPLTQHQRQQDRGSSSGSSSNASSSSSYARFHYDSSSRSRVFEGEELDPRGSKVPGFEGWYVGERYTIVRLLGHGSYGEVAEAYDNHHHRRRRVAIKRIRNVFENITDARRIYREMYILHQLQYHPNVVTLLDVIAPWDYASFTDLYMVFEYVDTDLYKLILSPQQLSNDHIETFIYQLLLALKFLQSANVIHRDLKPANVLLNEDCSLKLCDFGLARVVNQVVKGRSNTSNSEAVMSISQVPSPPSSSTNYLEDAEEEQERTHRSSSSTFFEEGGGGGGLPPPPVPPRLARRQMSEAARREEVAAAAAIAGPPKLARQLTKHVVTRWYRAPELILLQDYTQAVDVWSLGCIFAELLSMQGESVPNHRERAPLFPGKSCFPLSVDPSHVKASCVDKMDQLNVIFDVIGTPLERDLEAIGLGPIRSYFQALVPKTPRPLQEFYPGAHPEALDLLSRMLCFNPDLRITVEEALNHPYLQSVRSPALELSIGDPLVDRGSSGMSLEKIKRVLYEEIHSFHADHPSSSLLSRGSRKHS